MGIELPELDDKHFEAIMAEAAARLPASDPEWTDHNLSDPGVTLLELLAWLTDIDMYRLNRITPNHLLKFLKLSGASPRPVRPAQSWLTFETAAGSGPKRIGKGTRLEAERSGSTLRFEVDEALTVHAARVKSILVQNERGVRKVFDEYGKKVAYFFPFGEAAQKGSALYLGLDAEPDGPFTLAVLLYEEDLPPKVEREEASGPFAGDVTTRWEYWDGNGWCLLEVAKDGTGHFCNSGLITFRSACRMRRENSPVADEMGASVYVVRCVLARAGYEMAPRVRQMPLNTTRVRQVERNRRERVGVGTALPRQQFVLGSAPVADGEGAFRLVSMREGEQGVSIERWRRVEALEAYGPNERVFELDPRTGLLRFGDGVNGRPPEQEALLCCSYITSAGAGGNITQSAPWNFADGAVPGVSAAACSEAAGGTDPETVEAAFLRLRREMALPSQAVTAGDYEWLALHTPDIRVARAKAIADRSANAVTVVVVPYTYSLSIEPVPGEAFKQAVCRHLDRRRLLTTRVKVQGPVYVALSVYAKIKVRESSVPDDVERAVTDRLDTYLSPIRGGAEGGGWPFGRTVYRSEIYGVLEAVEGVECILELRLAAAGAARDREGNIPLEENALTASGLHDIRILKTQDACRSLT